MNTFHEDDEFERELRGRFATLGLQAPAGPSVEAVLGAVQRRRTRRQRFAAITTLAAAAVVALVVILDRAGSQHVAPTNSTMANRLADSKIIVKANPTKVAANASTPTAALSIPALSHEAAIDAASWTSLDGVLRFAPPANPREAGPLATSQPISTDWNLSLRLTLASAAEDVDGSQVFWFASPW